jgi:hypothetical protein
MMGRVIGDTRIGSGAFRAMGFLLAMIGMFLGYILGVGVSYVAQVRP